MIQLAGFKTQLFSLNLSVHNFLAALHCGSPARFGRAAGLKEEVALLYGLWDAAHQQTVGRLARTEETLASLAQFQAEVRPLDLVWHSLCCFRYIFILSFFAGGQAEKPAELLQ